MQGLPARAAQAYVQTHVQSRSPLELVVMLYDGLLRFIGEAQSAMTSRNLHGKREAMSRSLAILSELQSTLDMDHGGDLAGSLDALYTYINGRLLEGSLQNDPLPLDECARLLRPLREAWSEIAAQDVCAGAQAR
jgi:flagellar secretion chaperone FliS